MERVIQRLEDFLSGARFAVFALAILVGFKAILLLALVMPTPAGDLAGFAEDFKTWCFGYDPATGRIQWAHTATMLLEPVVLGAIVIGIWRQPLREAMAGRLRGHRSWAAAGLTVSIGVVVGLGIYVARDGRRPPGELPFPAEALRTSFTAPALDLVDQDGRRVTLEGLRGQVVVLTAVYSHCAQTCPRILTELREAMAALPPPLRDDVTVVGISLDPERDRPEVLADLARAYGVSSPAWRLVTGEPAAVEGVLDSLEFARVRDPETGVIEHANLFVLVDRGGQIAYRLALGESQQRWLVSALGVLLSERAVASARP